MDRLRTLAGITIFWVGLSMLGDGFATLVVPQRLVTLADPASVATVIGAVTFVGLLAGMLVQPLAGTISDALYPRWGRRGPLVVAVGLVLLALAAFASVPTLAGILVTFVLLMVAASVAQAIQQGFIPDRVPAARRGLASGARSLADLGGAFLGFLLLGALLAGGDVSAAVVAVAVVVVVTALLTVALVDESARPHGPRREVSFTGAFRFNAGAHPLFVRLVVARFLFLLGAYVIGRFFLLFVADRMGLDPQRAGDEAGGLLAALTLVSALGALPAGWVADRRGAVVTMIGGCILAGLGALLLLGARSPLEILVFGGVMSLGSAAFGSANWAMTADVVPPGDAARFLGIANFGTAGAAACAGLFGPIADIARDAVPGVGYSTILVAAVIAFVLSGVVVVSIRRRGPVLGPASSSRAADAAP